MAPMKRVASRGKRPVTASETERRSKHRNEAPPPRAASPPVVPPPASIACANRPIATGRKVNFNFLASEGFTFGASIRALGWEYLCTLDLPTYPSLMKELFSTFARRTGGLTGTVRGVEVTLTESILSRVLRLPREGPAPLGHEQRELALNLILGRDDCTPLEEVYANSLSVDMRLLLSIVNRVLFPKVGRFDFISERDLVVMQCIIEEIPLNLPQMMLSYITEAASRSRLSLPYGMVFTLLFREFGVPISDSEPKRLLRFTDFYDSGSLRRMGFQKVEGRWIRKSDPQADQAGPSVSPHSPPHSTHVPSSPPPLAPMPPPSTSSSTQPTPFSDEQLEFLATLFARKVSLSLTEKFDALSGEIRALSDRISVLESHRRQDEDPSIIVLRDQHDRVTSQIAELRDEMISTISEDHFFMIQKLDEMLTTMGLED